MNTTKRYFELDFLRGLAVVLMILFHFGYDLALFGYASYKTTQDIEWLIFRTVILSMFLLGVGMSLYLAYSDKIIWNKFLKRSLILAGVSVLISVGSYVVFPHEWIYFGVIHFILFASLAALLFVKTPYLALLFGLGVLISYWMGYFHFDPVLAYSVKHFAIPAQTVDVVSFTPWFALVLIGIFLMHKEMFGLHIRETNLTQKVSFLGKHSLLIYLVHQPVLFALFNLIKYLR